MNRRRQRHDRHISRRRARPGDTNRPKAKTASELRQDQLVQSTLKLAELAKGQPCLICGGSSDKGAISIAEPGSALLPANGNVRMRRIPYALCNRCAATPDLKPRIESTLLRLMKSERAVRMRVDEDDNVLGTNLGGWDAS